MFNLYQDIFLLLYEFAKANRQDSTTPNMIHATLQVLRIYSTQWIVLCCARPSVQSIFIFTSQLPV